MRSSSSFLLPIQVLQREGAVNVVLIRLYADAAPLSKSSGGESFYVFSWTDLATNERFLITVIRGQQLCKACGCRGRCTLYAIYQVIHWSLLHLMRKVHPSRRHDNRPLDPTRASKAGQPLPRAGRVGEFGADWQELAKSLGVKPHNTIDCPCLKCNCDMMNMHTYGAHVPSACPIEVLWI